MHKCNPLVHNGIERELYAYDCGVLLGPATAQAVCEYALCAAVCGCAPAAASLPAAPASPAALLCSACVRRSVQRCVRRCPLACDPSLVGCTAPRGVHPRPWADDRMVMRQPEWLCKSFSYFLGVS